MRSQRLVELLVSTLLLLGAFSVGQLYSASTSAQARQKWEYQVVGIPRGSKILNTRGEDGWEAVGLNNYWVLLKRSK